MVIRMSHILHAGKVLRRSLLAANRAASSSLDIPKGYLAVYVGENEKKRHLIPISYIHQPTFQELLCQSEEEFGFDYPMGGLTIPCREDIFIDLTKRFARL